MPKYFFRFNKTAMRSIGAGMLIALGALVFCSLYQESRIVGALCFSLGLLTTLAFNNYLYTGMIGLVTEDKQDYVFFITKDKFEIKVFWKVLEEVVLVFPHNLFGVGLIANITKHYTNVSNTATTLVALRINEVAMTPYVVLEKGMITGVCMYIAAACWKCTKNSPVNKAIIVILSVMAFILSGSYHVIADTYYFVMAPNVSFFDNNVLHFIFLVFLGNSLGSWIAHMYMRSIWISEEW